MRTIEMNDADEGAAMMRGLRTLTLMMCGLVVLLATGCGGGDSAPAQNTNVAGTWAISCTSADDDCFNFTITFTQNGDITDFNQNGVSQGFAHIQGGSLFFVVNELLLYQGTLDGAGNVATGTLTTTDMDGDETDSSARAARSSS